MSININYKKVNKPLIFVRLTEGLGLWWIKTKGTDKLLFIAQILGDIVGNNLCVVPINQLNFAVLRPSPDGEGGPPNGGGRGEIS